MKDEKWWTMAHEWYRDVVKVARTGVWYRDVVKFRNGPSIFEGGSQLGITKTGGRTSEDFRQEDWFRVGGDHDIKHLRLAHTNSFRLAHTSTF